MKKLSRNEMKNVMGGYVDPGVCSLETRCSLFVSGAGGNGQGVTFYGECGLLNGHCRCVTEYGDYNATSNGGDSYCGSLP